MKLSGLGETFTVMGSDPCPAGSVMTGNNYTFPNEAWRTQGMQKTCMWLPQAPAAAPPAPAITVSPVIQTAVSPQISPVFVQTGAGSSGAVGAGTSMTSPTQQQAGTTDTALRDFLAQQAALAAQSQQQMAASQAALLAQQQKSAEQAAASAAALAAQQEKDRQSQLDLINAQMKALSAQGTATAPAAQQAPVAQPDLTAYTQPVLPPVPVVSAPVTEPAPVAPAPVPAPSTPNMGLMIAAIAGVGLLAFSTKKGR